MDLSIFSVLCHVLRSFSGSHSRVSYSELNLFWIIFELSTGIIDDQTTGNILFDSFLFVRLFLSSVIL